MFTLYLHIIYCCEYIFLNYVEGAPDPVLFDPNLVASYDEMLDAECDEDCDFDCSLAVNATGRRAAYDAFRKVPETRVAQNLYLCASIELKHRTVDTDDDIIEQTAEFWLDVVGNGDGIKVKVCKTFFARTLGLPDSRLEALLEPETFEWFSRYRRRGDDYGESGIEDDEDYDEDYEHRRRRYANNGFGNDDEIPCTDFVLNSRQAIIQYNYLLLAEAGVTEGDEDTG